MDLAASLKNFSVINESELLLEDWVIIEQGNEVENSGEEIDDGQPLAESYYLEEQN